MTQRITMLVKTDAAENNNKFYEVKLEDDGRVLGRNGRVGTPGVIQNKKPEDYSGDAGFDKLVAEKIKGKYRPVEIMTSSNGNHQTSLHTNIVEVAKRDIAGNDPVLTKLLERLASINRFQLLSASGGQIDIVDGEVKTPVGLVTLNAVDLAKHKLLEMKGFVDVRDLGQDYTHLLQDYLMLVPQKIPLKRGWHEGFFSEFTTFQRQSELLEQLENSIRNSKPVPAKTDDGSEPAKVFGYSMKMVEDGKVFDKINRFYGGSVNGRHVTANKRLVRIYQLTNEEKFRMYEEVAKKLGNNQMLWHGTRAHNVLSILKGGLIIPPTNGGGYTIAGRMFGNGVYFSDQSTKSLNYSAGYWGSGGGEKGSIFMLNANVAMGRSYTPPGPTQHLPSGYDSIYAVGGRSGVQNNEMIVPRLNQIHLDYLCEFE